MYTDKDSNLLIKQASLSWVKGIEAQYSQEAMLESSKETWLEKQNTDLIRPDYVDWIDLSETVLFLRDLFNLH